MAEPEPIYVLLTAMSVHGTRELADGVNLDLDRNGEICGIEVLDAIRLWVNGRRVAVTKPGRTVAVPPAGIAQHIEGLLTDG